MTSPKYDFHIFICQNHRPDNPKGCCISKGSDKLLDQMKMLIKDRNIKNTLVSKSGCLGQCSRGIALVIYPQGTWYSIKSPDDVNEIISSHIQNNEIVNHLLMQ